MNTTIQVVIISIAFIVVSFIWSDCQKQNATERARDTYHPDIIVKKK